MSGENVAGAGGGESHIKWLAMIGHPGMGALQYGKGRVPFVQVHYLRIQPQRFQQAPSANP
jgi:hypothetical protein